MLPGVAGLPAGMAVGEGAPGVAPVCVALARFPEPGFVEKTRPVFAYSDYTSVFTCLKGIAHKACYHTCHFGCLHCPLQSSQPVLSDIWPQCGQQRPLVAVNAAFACKAG